MKTQTPFPQPQDLCRGPYPQDAAEAASEPGMGQGEASRPTIGPAPVETNGPRLTPSANEAAEDPLASGWEMFRGIPWQNIAQFVTAYNARFRLRRWPKNFAIQFARPWQVHLGVTAGELARLKHLMRLRQAQAQAAKYAPNS